MERAIGEKFNVNGRVYVAKEDNGIWGRCTECAFRHGRCFAPALKALIGLCVSWNRSDNTSVHFEVLENDSQVAGEKGGE